MKKIYSLSWGYKFSDSSDELAYFSIYLDKIGANEFSYTGNGILSGDSRKDDNCLTKYMLDKLDTAMSVEINEYEYTEPKTATEKIQDIDYDIKKLKLLRTRTQQRQVNSMIKELIATRGILERNS